MFDKALAALKDGHQHFLKDCSICGYRQHWRYANDQIEYDNGCFCTGAEGNWNPREEADFRWHVDNNPDFVKRWLEGLEETTADG